MPTQSTTYNSRLTDEALEKRFRDTFRSQGGAELVDDLYASGVIVPVVDFTAAAEGSSLPQYLQTSLDFSITATETVNTTDTIVNTSGFWRIDYQISARNDNTSDLSASINISDGLSSKTLVKFIVWDSSSNPNNTNFGFNTVYVFVRAGDSISQTSTSANISVQSAVRQVADVNGNLVNPSGFSFT